MVGLKNLPISFSIEGVQSKLTIDWAGDGRMTEEEFISACQNYGICAIDDDDDLRGNKQVRIQG